LVLVQEIKSEGWKLDSQISLVETPLFQFNNFQQKLLKHICFRKKIQQKLKHY